MRTFKEWFDYYHIHVGSTEREAHELASARVLEQENRARMALIREEFPPPAQRFGEWDL